ncbi:MAG: Hsp20/alpha crystallin family protein [Nitrospirae bacterium]|nr:MAG: Hsp20/alpha crystallin family protein [Nitrospirota bacterium]
MMLVKWDPFTEMEKSLSELFRRPWALRPVWDDRNVEAVTWKPAVNVYEDKDNLYIEAQLPGIDLKDVHVSVSDHTLQLRGERKLEHEENRDGYHVMEAQYGSFARSFTLPSYVDPDKAKATYDRGVLTITIPKQEQARARIIQIEAK